MDRSDQHRRGGAERHDHILHDVPMWYKRVDESDDPHNRAEVGNIRIDVASAEQDDAGHGADHEPVVEHLLGVFAGEVFLLFSVVLLVDLVVERHDAPGDAGKSDSRENRERP